MNADIHALAAAYALNALPTDQAHDFRHHLTDCPPCRQQTHQLQTTAARLAHPTSTPPPPRLRTHVLTTVHHTPQTQPPTATAHHTHNRTPHNRRAWPRWVAAAAASTIISAAGLTTILSATSNGPTPPDQTPLAAVMNAPDAQTTNTPLAGGGTITMVTSQHHRTAVLLHENLPKLPPSRIYQLWLIDPTGNTRPAHVTIKPNTNTPPVHLIPQLKPTDRVAITHEPAGGSPQPTTTPLAIINQT